MWVIGYNIKKWIVCVTYSDIVVFLIPRKCASWMNKREFLWWRFFVSSFLFYFFKQKKKSQKSNPKKRNINQICTWLVSLSNPTLTINQDRSVIRVYNHICVMWIILNRILILIKLRKKNAIIIISISIHIIRLRIPSSRIKSLLTFTTHIILTLQLYLGPFFSPLTWIYFWKIFLNEFFHFFCSFFRIPNFSPDYHSPLSYISICLQYVPYSYPYSSTYYPSFKPQIFDFWSVFLNLYFLFISLLFK